MLQEWIAQKRRGLDHGAKRSNAVFAQDHRLSDRQELRVIHKPKSTIYTHETHEPHETQSNNSYGVRTSLARGLPRTTP